MAVLRLYPEAKLGIAVASEAGFFHDFALDKQLTKDDLAAITSEMEQIIREKQVIQSLVLPREIAINTLLQRGQIYKAELLQDISDTDIHFYKIGPEFIDLCRHEHVHNTQELRAFQLNSISGAYWKGDETRPQLQRISGIAFRSSEEMRNFLERENLLAELDFRYIGEKLEYLKLVDTQIYYSPLGLKIIEKLETVFTDLARQSEFAPIGLPMTNQLSKELANLYASKNHSYRELPVRWLAAGRTSINKQVQAKDISGANLVSLTTIATNLNFDVELREQLNVLMAYAKELKLEISVRISTPDVDNDFVKTISAYLATKGISHTQVVNAKLSKVRVAVICVDEYERQWEMFQLNVTYPSNNLYTSREGDVIPAVSITSTFLLETILAYLLENKMGELPFWLSPRQCVVIPISEKYQFYAEKVRDGFLQLDVDVEIDARSEKMEARIRDAEVKKIPLIVIVGEKEEHSGTVSVRIQGGAEMGMMDLNEIAGLLSRVD